MASTQARTSPQPPGLGRRWNFGALLVVVAGIAVAVFAAAFAFGVVFETRNPVAAMAATGGRLPIAGARLIDLRIALAMQQSLRARGVTTANMATLPPSMLGAAGLRLSARENADIASLARDVVRMTPLSSAALRQLAFVEQDPERRERLLRLAHSVSRRDVAAALQLAEMQINKGQVIEALSGLNRALVVSSSLDETVFPLLAGAATDPVGAEQLRSLLRRDPEWAERLVRWAIANPAYLAPIASVVGAIPESSPARQIGLGQQMVDVLTVQRRFAEAFTIQRAYGSDSPSIANLTTGPFPPLDWQLIDNYDSGSRQYEKNVLEIFANPGRQGDFAQVIIRLEPGPHLLTLRIAETMGRGAELRFAAMCLGPRSDRTVAERSVSLANGPVAFGFEVPASECRHQRLVLRTAADNEAVGALVRSASLGMGTATALEGE